MPGASETFAASAARLAGQAGAVFGWGPRRFWRATPAELATVAHAIAGEEATPPDADTMARLREAYPDG